ncbi:UPF0481 protein At3g47200-like [Carya illinoinensis]|uniref:Uncharacterized protein n=1 Tax=Carya illinoinensis TaxID=32201 RepID=A0A8T1PAE8_CARIL|nr:UPF0481 protein At3g47200-like [Carya illinoinensis]KAG6641029.1 hypothetical protein CIPAW_09G044800 [Carya illinoinensis]KAG6694370.1 hypothetical protein I3842_09G044800 [Carya illinoinensis]
MAGNREHVISVEELLSRKVDVVRTEAGETSRGRDTSGLRRRIIELEEKECSPPSPSACKLKKLRFEKLRKAGESATITPNNAAQKASPKIQRVPLLLRDHQHFDKYFKPRIVAIGPIHHGEPKYKPAEAYKLRMANHFVQDSGAKDEILYDIVEKNIEQLRKCFDEEVTKKYDDQALAWMLFVDGCAILQAIYYVTTECKDFKIKFDHMAFGQQDLLLLENQVPYKLLLDLMNSSAMKDRLRNSIDQFIKMHSMGLHEEEGTTETPIHLLDLLRTRIIGKSQSPGRPMNKNTGGSSVDVQSYRNVQELRAAGIYVTPSKTGSLTTISFAKGYPGYLLLSPIIIDDSTGPKFLNLIAYEMCPDFYNDFEIASYISFLDSLIDHASDVMELRNAGILHNLLGSDKEVAQLFNEIGTDLVPDPDAYGEVKAAIQSHYKTQWKTWIAEALHDHFRSPWTFLAFSAAIVVLGLTFIQTWFSFKDDRSNSRGRVRR